MSHKPLGKRVLANLGRKWVQVVIAFLVFVLVLFAAHRVFIKPPPVSDAEKKKAESEFKFMHCDKCNKEMDYNKELANKLSRGGCKCPPGDTGYWTPTRESMASGGDPSERWFYTSILIGTTMLMSALWFLLARKDATPTHFYLPCLHCKEVLRYTKNGFDKLVECPSCDQPIRLPSEEEALSQEDQQDEVVDGTIDRYAARLKATGYQFPGEEQPAEAEPDADPNAPPDPNQGAR